MDGWPFVSLCLGTHSSLPWVRLGSIQAAAARSHGGKVFGLRFFCPDTASSEPKSGSTVRRLGKNMPSPKKSITQIMVLITVSQPLGCTIWQGHPARDHPSGPCGPIWSRSLSAALVSSLLSLECAHFAFRILCSW